jgi:hypothetical protein
VLSFGAAAAVPAAAAEAGTSLPGASWSHHCRSGRCRTKDPDPGRAFTNPSATSIRTASTATRSDTRYGAACTYDS